MPHLSDEALFSAMVGGEKYAQSILYRRYEILGRQIAGVFIRTKFLEGYTDQDFMECIHEAIMKVFKYYHIGDRKFYVYARDIITQYIQRKAILIEIEKEKFNTIDLDSPISNDDSRNFHEVVADNRENISRSIVKLDDAISSISSTENTYFKKSSKLYLLYKAGYSFKELSTMTNLNYYQVRKAIKYVEEHLMDYNLELELK